MTVAVEGKLGKRGLNANLAQGAAALTAAGLTGAFAASFTLTGAGTAAGAGAGAAAGAATAGILFIPLGIDAATGSMLNHNPNPITIKLPPKGTVFEPDPNVAILTAKLRKREARLIRRKCVERQPRTASECARAYRRSIAPPVDAASDPAVQQQDAAQ